MVCRAAGWDDRGKTYALVVDDFGNDGELALVGAGGEENDAAELDLAPGGCFDVGLTHDVLEMGDCHGALALVLCA